MLNSISWQDFLTVLGTVVGIYYLASTLLLYHADILQWIKNRSTGNSITENGNGEAQRLMGETKKQEKSEVGKVTLVSEDLLVSSSSVQESSILGTVSDFLEESKTLAAVVAEKKGTREDCVVVFRSLLERYAQLKGSSYQGGIAVSLHHTCKDICGFEFAQSEIDLWWPAQAEL